MVHDVDTQKLALGFRLTYQAELSNSLDFAHRALLTLPPPPLQETSTKPNHGNWTAIGSVAKNCGGKGTVYRQVVRRDDDGDEYRSAARPMTIEWRSTR